jgi:hypothetical protein
MLRWFPSLQVATACFSCSPSYLNFLDPYFIFMCMHYNHCHRATAHLQLNILLLLLLLLFKNVYRSSCKVTHILVKFQRNCNFLNIFKKTAQISNFIKIYPVGAELFHADGRTDQYDEPNSRSF